MRIEERVEIAAAPERIWAVMADVERWHEWTRSITRIEPAGERVQAPGGRWRIAQPGLPPAVWRITAWEPGAGFTWENLSPGMRSVAEHRIVPGTGGCTVRLVLDQTGMLSWLAALLFGKVARRYVKMEADGLKRRCETG